MGLISGLAWFARECAGVETSWRLFAVVWKTKGAPPRREFSLRDVLQKFLASAEGAVKAFGPKWARRAGKWKNLGTWILLGIWIMLPVGVVVLLSY